MLRRRCIFYAPIALMAFLVVPQLLQWSNQTSDSIRKLTESTTDEHLSPKTVDKAETEPVDEAVFTQDVRDSLSAIGITPINEAAFIQYVRKAMNAVGIGASSNLTQSDADEHLSPEPVDEAVFTQDVQDSSRANGIGAPSTSAKPAEQVELVQLVRGDLGKSLSIIAMGYIVKFFAQNLDPPVDVNIHYHTNNNHDLKLVHTKNDIKTCFSNFENADFYEFDDSENQKIITHNQYSHNNHIGLGVRNKEDFGKMMRQKINFISKKDYLEFQKARWYVNFEKGDPYLHCTAFPPPYLIDRYYDRLRKVFKFNNNCCKEKPDSDETVVHVRGFNKDIKGYESLAKGGYEEIGPMQMAQNMLGHLTSVDKVALVTPSPEIAEPYKAELEARGIETRIVSQSRVQDFCFMMNAQKELFGQHSSAHVFWAAILSRTVKKVSLYYVKNPLHTDGIQHYYEWKNPRLKDLFHYPVYESMINDREKELNAP